jgi:membrane protease YdiL (CAAX protease family)/uncharacterized RDD family membrane protein YckC
VIVADPSTGAPPYAGLVRRAVAILLDLALGWAAYSIAITLLDPNVAGDYATTEQTVLAAAIVLVTAILWLAYFVCAQWRFGQTLGMRAMGIRVVSEREQRLPWTRALLRSLLLVVDFAVGPLLIAASKRRQRLGDRLANTVVLMNHGDQPPPPGVGGVVEHPPAPPTAGGAPPPPRDTTDGPPTVPATWGPGRVFVGILVVIVLSVLEVGVVSIFDPGLDTLGGKIVSQLLLESTFIGVAFALAADHGFPGLAPAASLGLRRPLRRPWFIAASAYVMYLVAAIAYGALVHPHQRDITGDLGFGHGVLGAIIAGILIVLAAPVAEETFFRGFVFGGFRHRYPFLVAAVPSALLFGAIHASAGSLTVVPPLAFLGFLLCWVYEETGSIYSTIPLHMLNNAIAFTIIVST